MTDPEYQYLILKSVAEEEAILSLPETRARHSVAPPAGAVQVGNAQCDVRPLMKTLICRLRPVFWGCIVILYASFALALL